MPRVNLTTKSVKLILFGYMLAKLFRKKGKILWYNILIYTGIYISILYSQILISSHFSPSNCIISCMLMLSVVVILIRQIGCKQMAGNISLTTNLHGSVPLLDMSNWTYV